MPKGGKREGAALHGGKREGAGRPKGAVPRKYRKFWLSLDEWEKLKAYLAQLRKGSQ